MIKQVYDKKEIQTNMMVDVNGVLIQYSRKSDDFAYDFTVNIGEFEGGAKNSDVAKNSIMELISAMINQSYDHGAQWRIEKVETDESLLERYNQYSLSAYFRIKDTY